MLTPRVADPNPTFQRKMDPDLPFEKRNQIRSDPKKRMRIRPNEIPSDFKSRQIFNC